MGGIGQSGAREYHAYSAARFPGYRRCGDTWFGRRHTCPSHGGTRHHKFFLLYGTRRLNLALMHPSRVNSGGEQRTIAK